MRKVKCQYCEITDTPRSDMEFELVGKARKVRKYYHKTCYPEFLKEKEFRQKEQAEKDELVEVIKNIYGIKEVPRQAFPLIECLRNGEPVFGARQRTGKRYKEGYSYSLIKETFIYCEDTIHYWNNVKDFDGFMGAFKYALAIVIDRIYFVEQRVRDSEQKRKLVDKHIESIDKDAHIFETNYESSKKDEDDIGEFLDNWE